MTRRHILTSIGHAELFLQLEHLGVEIDSDAELNAWAFDVLDAWDNHLETGDDPIVEVAARLTGSGRPETFCVPSTWIQPHNTGE